MQFREIVKPLDRSNRRNNVDGEGEREEDQRKSKFIHWTIGKFSEWSMPRPRERVSASHLGKVFKTKGRWSGRRGKCGGRGERISSSREDEVVRAKAIGEHRLIICRSKDVMETAMASI